jgi:Bacterial aa3 type cytochrome c oxidase subunit IV
MAEHQHGTMDTRVQEKTFEGFIKVTVRSVITIIAIVIIMAIFGA